MEAKQEAHLPDELGDGEATPPAPDVRMNSAPLLVHVEEAVDVGPLCGPSWKREAEMSPHFSTMMLDGQAAVEARQWQRSKLLAGALLLYLGFGLVFYYQSQGWRPDQTLVFALSVLTGVGYGHLVPQGPVAMVVSAAYIILGLAFLAAFAGQVLEMLVQHEIGVLVETVARKGASGHAAEESLTYEDKCRRSRWRHCLAGLTLLFLLYGLVTVTLMLHYRLDAIPAAYLAAVSVFKLDSICVLEEVECSAHWQAHYGGRKWDNLLAIAWYVVVYGIVGYSLVSAAQYFGVDETMTIGKILILNPDQLVRMDVDGDGKVDRVEFLRDRLILADICDAEHIDRVLQNFEELDIDGSGFLSREDLFRDAPPKEV